MEPMPISLEWLEIAKLALTTGLVAALLSQGLAWLREWINTNSTLTREGRYVALRLAVILERFSLDCAHLIEKHDLHIDSGEHAGEELTGVPPLPDYPEDLDWRSLAPSLAARALSLRNELLLAERSFMFWYDIDADEVPKACREQASGCAHRAWMLARDLRRCYGLEKIHRHGIRARGAFQPGFPG